MEKFKKKYPTKVPVFVEPGKGETRRFAVGFPVSPNSKMVDIADKIRSKLDQFLGRFFFLVGAKNIPVTSSSTVGQLHEQYKDEEDGFLYFKYYGITLDKIF